MAGQTLDLAGLAHPAGAVIGGPAEEVAAQAAGTGEAIAVEGLEWLELAEGLVIAVAELREVATAGSAAELRSEGAHHVGIVVCQSGLHAYSEVAQRHVGEYAGPVARYLPVQPVVVHVVALVVAPAE